jgi:hypothetical protein
MHIKMKSSQKIARVNAAENRVFDKKIARVKAV